MSRNGRGPAASSRVVVVGASVAGVAAASAVRSAGFDGEIVLVGEEPHPPYDRPPLSKQLLCGSADVADIGLASARALPAASVVQRLGCRATALDVDRRVVVLDHSEELAYDGVVVATGSVARHLPGAEQPRGVHVLRTLDDAVAVRDGLVGAGSVVVVGAGFVGLEVACSARSLGIAVTVVESAPAPLSRVFTSDVGDRFTALHRSHGVDVRCGVGLSGLSVADGRVTAVQLDDGSAVDADLVVVGIGADPATDWLSSSGLELPDGLLCDAQLCAAPRIYAAGDVARWDHPLFGLIRVEHWMTAIEHARTAARNLVAEIDGAAAGTQAFAQIPYFWSDQYGVKIQMAGWASGYDELVEVELGGSSAAALLGREGRLVAALGWSAPAFVAGQKKLIADRASLVAATSAARSAGAAIKIKEGTAS